MVKRSGLVFLRNHWGLVILLAIFAILFLRNLNLNQDILGWDNFSVQLNLPLNLERSFFNSWREYRGLGVQNDSEQVDLFRILIYFLLSAFLPVNIIGQVYYFFLLALGCSGMYLLGRELLTESKILEKKSAFFLELAGLVSALCYLFSLHTIGTFYLPIAMYVARYGFFPVTVLFFVRLSRGEFTKRNVVLFTFFSLLLSTSYLTATVFLTFLFLIGSLIFSRLRHLKSYFITLAFFLFLNSFWLISFASYTIKNSSILPLASTFIEVNEIQLNQPDEVFSWSSVLSLKPSFFSTTYQSAQQSDAPVNPLAKQFDENTRVRFLVLLPSVIAIIGFISIFFFSIRKKNTSLLWLFVVFILAIFFLKKDVGPTGFIYEWLSQQLPILKIIFRFGAEKFSQLLVIVMSLSCAIFATFLLLQIEKISKILKNKKFRRVLQTGVVVFFLSLVSFPYLTQWWQGDFFSVLVKVNIPPQYHQVAQILDQQKEGRVLHLPFDEHSYWKSYQWGYVGSSFLSFLVDLPLVDRSFEPASLGNDQLDTQILEIVRNGAIANQDGLDEKSVRLLSLLEETQVKYILLDESINTNVIARESRYWGEFHLDDAKSVIGNLVSQGKLSKMYDEPVNGSSTRLALYSTGQQISFLQSIDKSVAVDSNLQNSLGVVDQLLDAPYYQDQSSQEFRTYPFLRSDSQLEHTDKGVVLSSELPMKGTISRQGNNQQNSKENGAVYAVFTNVTEDGLQLSMKKLENPILDESQMRIDFENDDSVMLLKNKDLRSDSKIDSQDFTGNWSALHKSVLENYRLQINDQVLPIPADSGYFTAVNMADKKIEVKLLKKDEDININPLTIQKTEDINCFKDRTEGYFSTLNYTSTEIKLSTKEGTSCLTFDIPEKTEKTSSSSHTELRIKANASTEAADASKNTSQFENSRLVTKAVDLFVRSLPQRTFIGFCFINPETGQCLNTVQIAQVDGQRQIVAPLENNSSDIQKQQVLLTFASQNKDQIDYELLNVAADTFEVASRSALTAARATQSNESSLSQGNSLRITVPFIFSSGSYFMDSSARGMTESYNGSCEQSDGYRTTRYLGNNRSLGYVSNCQQGFFSFVPVNVSPYYLWTAQYQLYSGKDPKFTLQGTGSYKNEYLSRYQLFPEIPGFRNINGADQPFNLDLSSEVDEVKFAFDNPQYHDTFTTVSSPVGMNSEKSILPFQVTQHSENQGLLEIAKMNVFPLPESWYTFYLDIGKPEKQFAPFVITSSQRVLPSVWKFTGEFESQEATSLLQFNQAFDSDWVLLRGNTLFDAVIGYLFGPEIAEKHVKTNGWSNGWLIYPQTEQHGNTQTFFILYFGELLQIAGWMMTGLTLIGVVYLLVQRKRR